MVNVCVFDTNAGFRSMFDCVLGAGFGFDYFIIALLLIGAVAFLAYKYRLPSSLMLGLAFALVYSLDIMSGGTYLLRVLLVLCALGIIVSIAYGVLSLGERYSG